MANGFQAVPFQSAMVLRLEPGDVVVVRVRHDLSEHEHAEFSHRMADLFPDHRVLVLGPGTDLEVLRKA